MLSMKNHQVHREKSRESHRRKYYKKIRVYSTQDPDLQTDTFSILFISHFLWENKRQKVYLVFLCQGINSLTYLFQKYKE